MTFNQAFQVKLQTGDVFVVTDETYSGYCMKGVYRVERDCEINADQALTDDAQRFEQLGLLVLDGSLVKLPAKQLWLGSSTNGLQPQYVSLTDSFGGP